MKPIHDASRLDEYLAAVAKSFDFLREATGVSDSAELVRAATVIAFKAIDDECRSRDFERQKELMEMQYVEAGRQMANRPPGIHSLHGHPQPE